MNRGPQTHAGQGGFVAKLGARMGTDAPEWLSELAATADRLGLRVVAERLDYSRATVSQVLSGNYRGDVDRVEQVVRGALMRLTVDCPVLGETGRDTCLYEQKQPFRPTSALRAQLYHTCRGGCPHARLGTPGIGGTDAD